jgi:hypothetical protein
LAVPVWFLDMIVSIGQWKVYADPVATGIAYQATKRGSPADCDCLYCRNFDAIGDAAYPAAFASFADTMGIDIAKTNEIVELGDFREGRVLYEGWFHVVGSIVEGPVPLDLTSSVGATWHHMTESFQVSLSRQRDLPFDELAAKDLVQLNFLSNVPWVLDEPYPG